MASSRSSPPAERPPDAGGAAGPAGVAANPLDVAAGPVEDAVQAALAAFAGGRCSSDTARRVAIGLSGGRDSMALLDAAVRVAAALPVELSAVHVHHGLSPRADDWAAFCSGACRERGVALTIRRVDVARRGGQSLEAAARSARYAAFAGLEVDAVALAHHADDQAETLLLQLLRGAGPHGAAAMARATPPRATGPALLRPLLGLPRRAIDAYVAARGIAHVDDDSNADVTLRRNRLRQEVAPLLAAAFPGYPQTLVRAAGHQAEAAQLLDELAALDARGAVAPALPGTAPTGGGVLDRRALTALSDARARNLLRWFLCSHDLRPPSAASLASMLSQIAASAADARVAIAHDGATLGVHRGWIAIHREPAAGWEAVWRGEPELALPHGTLAFRALAEGGEDVGIASAALAGRPLAVRAARGGERLRLAAGRPRRALTDLWREAGVPPWARTAWPLLFCGGELAAVPGLGIAPPFAVRDGAPGYAVAWRPAGERPQSLTDVNHAPDATG
jgi:tRNA(Ile)-lysidine synthase